MCSPLPLAIGGALLGLYLSGQSLNLYSQIGLVMLVGLAAKNGILIVEFARNKQDEGLSRIDAVVEACRLRLRPILMTAFSSVLGFLPLIIATGAGAEMRIALGVGVVAGMLGVTFFGLFFTPVFYSVIMKFADRNKTQPNAEETTPQAPPKPSAS